MSDLRVFAFGFKGNLSLLEICSLFPGVDFSPGLLVSKGFVCLIYVFSAFGFTTGNMFIFSRG